MLPDRLPARRGRSCAGGRQLCALVTVLLLNMAGAAVAMAAASQDAGRAMGPLRAKLTQPAYFHDPAGKPVYLTGSHTWSNLVDMDDRWPPRPFDFERYLDFLEQHNHNFIRLWTWELGNARSDDYERRRYASPLPWPRTGPGEDVAGLPRFDVSQPNPDYYQRLQRRVALAAERGIYVSVMLFEGWGVQFAPGRDSHPFNRANNINGVHYGEDPSRVHTLTHPRIVGIQEAHIRRVVDAVNGYDNVLYEIVNEAGPYSTAWQRHMIKFLREYQAGKPRQHPVGMTYQHPNGRNDVLFASDADWISPSWESGFYGSNPAPNYSGPVILNDTDHLGGSGFGQPSWVWKSFLRGLNPLFMDIYEPPDALSAQRHYWSREMRAAMGLTRLYAERMDLRSVRPRPNLASSGYVLAGAGEMLVYTPDGGSVFVDLRGRKGSYTSEWFNPETGEALRGAALPGEAKHLLRTPFAAATLLYLTRNEGNPAGNTMTFETRAQEILQASHETQSLDALSQAKASLRAALKRWLPSVGYRELLLALAGGIAAGLVLGLPLALWVGRRRAQR